MTEGWDDVIMHLAAAQRIAEKLPRNRWWDTYIDEMTGDSALSELIESAKSELGEQAPPVVTLPSGHTSTCSCQGSEANLSMVHPFTD